MKAFALTAVLFATLASALRADPSDSIFDQTRLRTYQFTVQPADWKKLNADIAAEQCVPAKLSVDGKELGTVGIRYKGSTFSLEGCSGKREGVICSKISLKVKFDEYTDSLRYGGMKSLNFNSMMYDPSALRERIAYSLFREMGVVTARAVHAKVEINGEYRGLYSLVEQIDDSFIARNFPEEKKGTLLKEAWPITDDSTYYKAAVRGTSKSASTADFVTLYREITAAKESDLTKLLAQRLDPEYLMNYMAVDRAICNWDGVTAFYKLNTRKGYASHNFYWYQPKGTLSFRLLPWDLDGTMNFSTGFDHVPEWNAVPDSCDKKYSIFDGETEAIAPGCDKLMRGFALLGAENNRYAKAMEKLLMGSFKAGHIESEIDLWAAQISEAVKADAYGPPFGVWQTSTDRLRDEVSILRARLQERLTQKKVLPFSWSSGEINGFENTELYPFQLGVYQYSNLKSCVRVGKNLTNPIAGTADLRIDFDMYNETDNPETGGFGQWVWVGSSFGKDASGKEIVLDFAQKKIIGIRFTAYADRNRQIWSSIKSNAYLADNGGCNFGWNSDITDKPKTVECYFKDGGFPGWQDPIDKYDLDSLLSQTVSCSFSPLPEGRDENGLFPEGGHDKGFVHIDNISFITESAEKETVKKLSN